MIGALGVWLGVEAAHWRAARRLPHPAPGPAALLVLGYPARAGGVPHPRQRWRIDIAMRSLPASGPVIFSGGATGDTVEADVMAELAQAAGLDPARIVLESTATTTWENIERSRPHLIVPTLIVSDPLHAARAAGYLQQQDPQLAAHLAGALTYRFGEHPVMKFTSAFFEVYMWARRRRRKE